jgi:hypothetical protein
MKFQAFPASQKGAGSEIFLQSYALCMTEEDRKGPPRKGTEIFFVSSKIGKRTEKSPIPLNLHGYRKNIL